MRKTSKAYKKRRDYSERKEENRFDWLHFNGNRLYRGFRNLWLSARDHQHHRGWYCLCVDFSGHCDYSQVNYKDVYDCGSTYQRIYLYACYETDASLCRGSDFGQCVFAAYYGSVVWCFVCDILSGIVSWVSS